MLKAADIAKLPGVISIRGDPNREINSFSSILNPQKGSLTFCKEGYESYLSGLEDCTVIVPCVGITFIESNTYILSGNPRLLFAHAEKSCLGEERLMSAYLAGIHPTAIIDCDRTFIAKDVEIGPYTWIKGECSIGENTRIGSHVHIEGKVVIGKNVCILSLATIGAAATGYVRNEEGELEYMPQLGGVFIADDVGIGSRVNVHRGALEDTTIGQGSVIGVSCNVGHNVVIGKHTGIAGKSNLGGKTRIGDYCNIGLSVVTVPSIRIGNNVTIGAGSVVTKDVEDGCVAYGVPAKVRTENVR